MAKREYIPTVALPKSERPLTAKLRLPGAPSKTKAERLAEEKRRLDARAIGIDAKRKFEDLWATYGAEARAQFLMAKESNPTSAESLERKILEDMVVKWSRENQVAVPDSKTVDLAVLAKQQEDAKLGRFSATERLQQDRLDRDFVRNTTMEVLSKLVQEKFREAEEAKGGRRATPGGGVPGRERIRVTESILSPEDVQKLDADRERTRKLKDLASANAALDQRDREAEAAQKTWDAEAKRLAEYNRSIGVPEEQISLLIRNTLKTPPAEDPKFNTVVAREALKIRAQEYGLAIPSASAIPQLELKESLLTRAISRKKLGGYKTAGVSASVRSPTESALRAAALDRLREHIRTEQANFIQSRPDLFPKGAEGLSLRDLEQLGSEAKNELRRVASQARREYLDELKTIALSPERAGAAGRSAIGVTKFAEAEEKRLYKKASDYVSKAEAYANEVVEGLKQEMGQENWDNMGLAAQTQKLQEIMADYMENVVRSFEKPARDGRVIGFKKTSGIGQPETYEPVFGTPADLTTLRQVFRKPELYIYTDWGIKRVRGTQRGFKRPNPTFVAADGSLLPNPEFVKAQSEGKDTSGIPETLYARAVKKWEESKDIIQESAYSQRIENPEYLAAKKEGRSTEGIPRYKSDVIRVAGRMLSLDTPEGQRARYAKTLRDGFYARARVIDPSNRVISEARRRVRDEAQALGLAVGQKGTKEEKTFAKEWVESRVPLMVGSIPRGAGALQREGVRARQAAGRLDQEQGTDHHAERHREDRGRTAEAPWTEAQDRGPGEEDQRSCRSGAREEECTARVRAPCAQVGRSAPHHRGVHQGSAHASRVRTSSRPSGD